MIAERKLIAVILAAGSGKRMNTEITKQRMSLLGTSILKRCVSVFDNCEIIDEIIVVVRQDELDFARAELSGLSKVRSVFVGGKSRAESAIIGVNGIEDSNVLLMIHDGARCLISENDIERVARDAVTYGCATASTPVYDTVKQVAKDGRISATVDRSVLRAVQTPQCMPLSLYKEAIASVTDLSLITDDNMMLESIGSHPFCSDTSANNIKITTPEDIAKAEYILSANKKI